MTVQLPVELKNKLKTEAKNLGFTHIGVCDPNPPSSFPVFQDWLQKGYAAGMSYLSRQDTLEKRKDPKLILSEVESIIVLALPYQGISPEQSPKPKGKIAAYALGKDYHLVIPALLEKLMEWLSRQVPDFNLIYKIYTDTGPILEREYAVNAGLGWIGKNSCLLIPGQGSYFLLAEIFINYHFPPDNPFLSDHCGSCRRCIENCPTACINENRTIDANHCISYLTIENRDTIPVEDRENLGTWIFGCDICQQVCPWNIRFSVNPKPNLFPADPKLADYDLFKPENTNLDNFKHRFFSSPISRAKKNGFIRNIVVALGNIYSPKSIPILIRIYLSEENSIIKNLIIWALQRFPLSQIEETLQSETDEIAEVMAMKKELLSHLNENEE